jgi:hypothetical protein
MVDHTSSIGLKAVGVTVYGDRYGCMGHGNTEKIPPPANFSKFPLRRPFDFCQDNSAEDPHSLCGSVTREGDNLLTVST